MDQLKKFLAGVQKNSFWIVSGLTIILGIVGYWMARSTMDEVFATQASKIDQAYSALQTISSDVPTHPNAKTHEKMDQQIQSLVSDVETAWRKQYERQAAFMQWPASLPPSFVAKVKDLRPIEVKLEYPLPPASDPLVRGDLANYAKYVDDQFPALAQIIGTKWVGSKPAATTGGGMGSGMGGYMGGAGGMDTGYGAAGSDASGYGGAMGGYGGGTEGYGAQGYGGVQTPVSTDLVIWPKPVQDAVFADVQMWRGAVPTTHEVLYTQENIWILEGLLKIIAQVNAKANAVANFQATVKEIEFLRVGRSAVGRVGTIDRPGVQGGGMGGYGGMADYGSMGSAMGGMGGEGAEEMGSGSEMASSGGSGSAGLADSGEGEGEGEGSGMYGMVAATPDPANGRYVDAAYAPLTGEDLRTRMKSSSPEDAYFAVAKRVPVRMRLKVDQRRIQTLLAECGNADLMFEIRQVRIGDTAPAPAAGAGGGYGMNLYGSGEGSGMGGYGGGMGGLPGEDAGSGYGGMGGMGGYDMGGYGMGGMGGMATIGPSKVWDIPVELYGVVYLFNPVDTEKLGLNKVTADTEVSDKVEVSADEAQAAEGVVEGQAAPAQSDAPAEAGAGQGAPGQPGGPGAGQGVPGQQGAPRGGQGAPSQPDPAGQGAGGQAPAAQLPNGSVEGAQARGMQAPGMQAPQRDAPGGAANGQVPLGAGANGGQNQAVPQPGAASGAGVVPGGNSAPVGQ